MSHNQIGFNSYLDGHKVGASPHSSAWQPKFCEHTPTLLFSREHVNYYGAAKPDRLDKAPVNAVYVSFAGDFLCPQSDIYIHDKCFVGMEQHVRQHELPAVCVDWTDFSSPPVSKTFWRALHEKLAALDPKEVNAVFYCRGGHGRTGTALAAMLIDGTWSTDDALEYIREAYCTSAIESAEQEDYLYQLDFELNEREIPVKKPAVEVVTSDAPPRKLTRRERKKRARELREQWAKEDEKRDAGFNVSLDGNVQELTDSNHYNTAEWWRE